MTISKYQVLLRVIELDSFTKAAEELSYAQSGVSYIIKSLEQELGFQLIHRGRQGITLTENGKRLLPVITRIAREERELQEEAMAITDMVAGKLCIGTFCSATANWLPHIIKEFLGNYPSIDFDLVDTDYEQLETMLLGKKLDCAFLPRPQSKELSYLPLIQDRYYAFLPAEHPAKNWHHYPLGNVKHEYFVLPREGLQYDLGRFFSHYEITPNIRMRAMDSNGAIAMVKAGLGVTILSEACLNSNQLEGCLVKELEQPFYRELGIATHPEQKDDTVSSIFVSYAKDWMTKNT
ncbi:MAG: LysR family transcriptional regulator [Eubacteriales bacterium]|nr:LysR family transcriptional regulator [Eubacteriales bacterium]